MWFYTHDKAETKNVIKELFGTEQNSDFQVENKKNNKIIVYNNDITNNNILENSVSDDEIILQDKNKRNSEIKIEILNGTADSSKLNEIKTMLKDKGYNVIKTGITSNTSKTKIINRRAKSNDVINSIKKDLNNVGVISSATNNSNADITIIIGKDYE